MLMISKKLLATGFTLVALVGAYYYLKVYKRNENKEDKDLKNKRIFLFYKYILYMVFIFLLMMEVRSIIKNFTEKNILDRFSPNNKILKLFLKILLRILITLISLKSLDFVNLEGDELNLLTILVLIISAHYF